MKVLLLVNEDIVVYNFRRELAQELVCRGYEVYISTPVGEFCPYLESIGCKIIETPVSRRKFNLLEDMGLFWHYIAMIRELSPSMVLTYTIKPNIYGGLACRLCGVSYMANICGLGTVLAGGGLLGSAVVALYRAALGGARRVFFQNRDNREYFHQRRIAAENAVLVSGSGVNLDYFAPVDYPSEEHPLEFAYISRIMKPKGIEEYLTIARRLKVKHPEYTFHVCGECIGDYHALLQSMQDEGVIIYHGRLSDIRPILARVSCVIHPTYYPEGISNVLLEAQACCRPVITTDRVGCHEAVDPNVSGLLVAARDTDGLLAVCERFIGMEHSSKAEMGRAGRRYVENHFDRTAVVRVYMDEITQCVEEGPALKEIEASTEA